MAQLETNFTIKSSGLTSDDLSFSVKENLTVTQGGISRYAVTGTAVGTAYTLYTAGDQTGPVYMYIKNVSSTGSDLLNVFLDSTDKKVVIKLKGGEFAWLTLQDTATYQVYGSTAETIVEYGIFA